MLCRIITLVVGVSPNGKATDSDSVISRFESLYPSFIAGMPGRLYGLSGIFVLCHCMSDTLEDFPDIGTVPFLFFLFPCFRLWKGAAEEACTFPESCLSCGHASAELDCFHERQGRLPPSPARRICPACKIRQSQWKDCG